MLNATFVYSYDGYGNLTYKRKYSLTAASQTPLYPIKTDTYTYGNYYWGDQLTAYNGSTITYDGAGNPFQYYNGFFFGWKGRQLVAAADGSNDYSFTYNDEGIRTSKTVNGVTTKYYLNGSMIVGEETEGNLTMYIYDSAGMPLGMQYHGADYVANRWDTYWFEKNIQGDIVAVYDAAGTKLIGYFYDAWGNFTTAYYDNAYLTSAVNNPFTYRGYYYDRDLGLYYLNSRYYDANIGRFISPDAIDTITASPTALTDKNLYAYCDNNPVMRADYGGEFWHIIIGAVVGAAVNAVAKVISNVCTGKEWHEGVAAAALSGAASGALSATGLGPIVQIAGNAIISAGESIANQLSETGEVDVKNVLLDSAIGAVLSFGSGQTKGDAKHLMTQGINATKQIFKEGFKKSAKYYFSQTYTLFYKKLIRSASMDALKSIANDVMQNSYRSYANNLFERYFN